MQVALSGYAATRSDASAASGWRLGAVRDTPNVNAGCRNTPLSAAGRMRRRRRGLAAGGPRRMAA